MDLGTANTIIISDDKIVVDEPSVVALDRRTEKMIAVGDKAKMMYEKTHDNIRTIRPLRDERRDEERTECSARHRQHDPPKHGKVARAVDGRCLVEVVGDVHRDVGPRDHEVPYGYAVDDDHQEHRIHQAEIAHHQELPRTGRGGKKRSLHLHPADGRGEHLPGQNSVHRNCFSERAAAREGLRS